jgi:hypothetical protein
LLFLLFSDHTTDGVHSSKWHSRCLPWPVRREPRGHVCSSPTSKERGRDASAFPYVWAGCWEYVFSSSYTYHAIRHCLGGLKDGTIMWYEMTLILSFLIPRPAIDTRIEPLHSFLIGAVRGGKGGL